MPDTQSDNEFQDIHDALGIRPFTPDQLAPASPLMSEMQSAPGKIASGVGNALGINDAMNALRGNMTPEEAQSFALGAAPGLLPMGKAEHAGELAWSAVKPIVEDAWKAGKGPTGALVEALQNEGISNPFKHIAEKFPEYDNFLDHLNDKYGDWADIARAKSEAAIPDFAKATAGLPKGYTTEQGVNVKGSFGQYVLSPEGKYLGFSDNMADLQKIAKLHANAYGQPSLDDAAIAKHLAANPGASIADLAGLSQPVPPYATSQRPDLKAADFHKYITPIENWQDQLSQNTPRVNPLEFDSVEARERARSQGYNVDLPLFKGGAWNSYQDELKDPRNKGWEKGSFFSDDPEVAGHYTSGSSSALPYVVRAHSPMEVDWPTATGLDSYNSGHLNSIIHAARDKGADMVIVRGMFDMGGVQDQYVVLDPKIVRQPGAEFAPEKMNLAKLAAGVAGTAGAGAAAEGQRSK